METNVKKTNTQTVVQLGDPSKSKFKALHQKYAIQGYELNQFENENKQMIVELKKNKETLATFTGLHHDRVELVEDFTNETLKAEMLQDATILIQAVKELKDINEKRILRKLRNKPKELLFFYFNLVDDFKQIATLVEQAKKRNRNFTIVQVFGTTVFDTAYSKQHRRVMLIDLDSQDLTRAMRTVRKIISENRALHGKPQETAILEGVPLWNFNPQQYATFYGIEKELEDLPSEEEFKQQEEQEMKQQEAQKDVEQQKEKEPEEA